MTRVYRPQDRTADKEFDLQDQRLTRLEQGGIPVGCAIPYGGTTAPTGFLLCDGSTYSVRTYPDLFRILERRGGTPAPDNGENFAVPNLTLGNLTYIIKAVNG